MCGGQPLTFSCASTHSLTAHTGRLGLLQQVQHDNTFEKPKIQCTPLTTPIDVFNPASACDPLPPLFTWPGVHARNGASRRR